MQARYAKGWILIWGDTLSTMTTAGISGRAGFPVADNGCRPTPWPFHPPPHPFARPAAIATTRTPDISRRICETDSPTAFEAVDLPRRSETEAGNLPGAETIVRHSCLHSFLGLGQWLSIAKLFKFLASRHPRDRTAHRCTAPSLPIHSGREVSSLRAEGFDLGVALHKHQTAYDSGNAPESSRMDGGMQGRSWVSTFRMCS